MKKIIAAFIALCLLYSSALASSMSGSENISGGLSSGSSVVIPDDGGYAGSPIIPGGPGSSIAGPEIDGTVITQNSAVNTAKTTITYSVAEDYVVVIPSGVSFAEGQTAATAEIVIQKGGRIAAGKTLSVNLTGSANDFKLVNAADSSATLAYAVNGVASNAELASKEPFASISAMDLAGLTADAETTLSFEITGALDVAGSFSDTLTFTVTIAD